MTTAVVSGAVAMAAALPNAVTTLAQSSLSTLSDDEVLEVVRLAEQARLQLEAPDQTLVAEIQHRGLPGQKLYRSTAKFLSALLNLSPYEAAARVRHADYLGPRLTIGGDPMEPLLPVTAKARAAGKLTARQVDVIIRSVKRLDSSDAVTPSDVDRAEAFLVDQARIFDATTLAGVAQQLIDTLDPDGRLADEAAQHRRRHLSLLDLGDGMHRITGDLDADTAAMAMTVLHSLAAPKRSGVGDKSEPDPRTPGQRLHDAFKTLLQLALRAGELPRSGGVPATVIITMTAEQFETGTGLAATSFGQKMTVPQALRVAGEASIAWIVHNSTGGILNYGRTGDSQRSTNHRPHSQGQRLRVPRLHRSTGMDRTTPHHTAARRRLHRRRRPVPALRLPPRPHRHRRLENSDARRHPLVHPTRMDRPRPNTSTQLQPMTSEDRRA